MSGNTVSIIRRAESFLTSETILRGELDGFTDEEVAMVWSVIDVLEKKVLKARKGDLRARLFEIAESQGEVDAKGSFLLAMEGIGSSVKKEFRSGKVTLNGRAAMALAAKHLGEDPSFEDLVSREPVVQKEVLEDLLGRKLITRKEFLGVATVAKNTWALKVKVPPEIAALVSGKK